MSGPVYLIYMTLTVYGWLILARAVMSWLNLRPGGAAQRVYAVLVQVTEPYIGLFRRIIPARLERSGVDLSPLVALVVLFLVLQVIARL